MISDNSDVPAWHTEPVLQSGKVLQTLLKTNTKHPEGKQSTSELRNG